MERGLGFVRHVDRFAPFHPAFVAVFDRRFVHFAHFERFGFGAFDRFEASARFGSFAHFAGFVRFERSARVALDRRFRHYRHCHRDRVYDGDVCRDVCFRLPAVQPSFLVRP